MRVIPCKQAGAFRIKAMMSRFSAARQIIWCRSYCSGCEACYPRAMRYVIVDLEATCWMKRVEPQQMEIIEIGALLLASKTGPVQREFASFVRPIYRPKLSAFCMGLTGIRQQEVDPADDFSKAFPNFLHWIGPEPYRLCSWSIFDFNQFKTDCTRHRISFPPQFLSPINLKQEFARLREIHPCGVKRAFALCQLQLKGKSHRALDDARNIAKLALKEILPHLE